MKHRVDVLFKVHRDAGRMGLTTEEAAKAYREVTGREISTSAVRRFRKRRWGKFQRVEGNRYALKSADVARSNVIPFVRRTNERTAGATMKNLTKTEKFVLDGFKKFAGTEGLVCDDLDKKLRAEDVDSVLGPVEKRRCHHATTKLKMLGLVEVCDVVANGPTRTGKYRVATVEKTGGVEKEVKKMVAEEKTVKTGVVLRRGEWTVECPTDATPEFIANLMNGLAAKTG